MCAPSAITFVVTEEWAEHWYQSINDTRYPIDKNVTVMLISTQSAMDRFGDYSTMTILIIEFLVSHS